MTSTQGFELSLQPAEKVIGQVRKTRKDIFLVGFKTTTGATPQEQFDAGLTLLKKSSCNLVLANDLVTRTNMIVTPEQAPYHVTTDRKAALRNLVAMTFARSKGHFTRSQVVEGVPVHWNGEVIPASLREVVNYCIARGAYKPFMGTTVGHFAFKVPVGRGVPPQFITSRRGVNFNNLKEVGMVAVMTDGDDKVIAMGAKPSVGGQSQRIIFAEHPDVDCIVHFHCPLKPGVAGISVRSQEPYECGSHECGENTSRGLVKHMLRHEGKSGIIKAIMLDKHGANVAFHHDAPSPAVIAFIEEHWDLERSTREVLL